MARDSVGNEATEEGAPTETSWDRIARKRRLRTQLEREIMAETPAAVAEAKAAGLKVADLSKLWGVTSAWIYTVAPARKKAKQSNEKP